MVAKQYQRNLGGLYLNEGDPEAWCEAGSNGGAVTHPPADPAGSFGRARFTPRPPEPPPGPLHRVSARCADNRARLFASV
jgi:hypothetical protein